MGIPTLNLPGSSTVGEVSKAFALMLDVLSFTTRRYKPGDKSLRLELGSRASTPLSFQELAQEIERSYEIAVGRSILYTLFLFTGAAIAFGWCERNENRHIYYGLMPIVGLTLKSSLDFFE